jgi:LuxR family maltose regulon positive regulatory protein
LTTQSAIDALGKILLEFGELKQAARIHLQAIELADTYAKQAGVGSRNVGLAYNGLANLNYEWNEIEEAEYFANQAIEMFEPWGVTENLLDSYNILARIKMAQDDVESTLEIAQMAADLVQNPQSPDWLQAQVVANQARHWIKLGKESPEYLVAASKWATHAGINPEDDPTYFRELEYITLARLYLARRAFDDGLNLLDRLLTLAESTGRNGRLIELTLLRAMAHLDKGEMDFALRALARSMALAEPEDYKRIYLDEGSSMYYLLQEAERRGVFPQYCQQLMATYPEAFTPSFPLPEPLSERELEVLRLMSSGHSGPQIAEQLYLSINTVKTHVKNVYRKLGVNQRYEAIQKAKDVGLI